MPKVFISLLLLSCYILISLILSLRPIFFKAGLRSNLVRVYPLLSFNKHFFTIHKFRHFFR